MPEETRGLSIDEAADVPRTFKRFSSRFPDIAAAHEAIGKAGDGAGPLDRKMVELIKLGICVGAGLESATKSHARRAVQHGATRDEVEQAVALAVNPVGLPRAVMGWQWATEQLDRE
ncbi:MAG: carboxymuconolactone decarboxylase family protein [Gemmatimonadetes bacterium]|nr:carboxymuconolactone decarboxylase family protein [Gemmatimonadota bacterium]NIU78898.1 carboxymuconolactone decarboxylase family protein [Gammaproteobacteria bacterium]NIW35623.1 carboxymuconolactone decarboxylase family protein [Gemmatimonadota bacterium]NIX47663.1 carboxymuconolactone decarboxylase family protein [Gemmatimonadota bacterium]NIY12037.1 carboxymuconolactone decarboxylase family protein [Gemmatimonadota bacterium]